jgi:hypothetical protein
VAHENLTRSVDGLRKAHEDAAKGGAHQQAVLD